MKSNNPIQALSLDATSAPVRLVASNNPEEKSVYSVSDNVARKRVFQTPFGSDIGLINGKALSTWLLPFVYNMGLSDYRVRILPWIFIGGIIFPEPVLRDSSTVSGNGFA